MSNKKLNENKQVMNESFMELVGDFMPHLTMGLLAAIKIGLMLVDKTNFKSSMLSKNVYDALEKLYEDKEFVKDFVEILKKEGNLQDITDDILARYKDDVHKYHRKGSTERSRGADRQMWSQYIWRMLKDSSEEWNWNAPEKRIIDSVLKSNGYRKFSKKHNFTKEDDTMMRAVLYYMISRPDFSVTVKKYLNTAVAQNKSVIIRAIDRSDFDISAGS
jgi:hypothetical protein